MLCHCSFSVLGSNEQPRIFVITKSGEDSHTPRVYCNILSCSVYVGNHSRHTKFPITRFHPSILSTSSCLRVKMICFSVLIRCEYLAKACGLIRHESAIVKRGTERLKRVSPYMNGTLASSILIHSSNGDSDSTRHLLESVIQLQGEHDWQSLYPFRIHRGWDTRYD